MKPTLKSIADLTGMSISTVSRVLRGESKIRGESVDHIIKVAKELNYTLDESLLYKSYNYEKRIKVALVTSFQVEEFFASMFKGLSEAASEKNIDLCLFDIDTNKYDIPSFLKHISELGFDAVILFVTTFEDHKHLESLSKLPDNLQLVSISPSFNPVLETVTFDSYRGGYIIADHFNTKKFKDVGIITGPLGRYEALLRKNGFSDYVQHQSDMNLIWTFNGNYSIESGKDAYKAFRELKVKPRAIFGSNDSMCIGFILEAIKDGVRIPEDLAIAGYDDIKFSKHILPSLTTIRTSYRELGLVALDLIERKIINAEKPIGNISLIPVSLIQREST